MAETPASYDSDSDDRSSDSMGPSSAGWASLVKDSPAAAWLPSLAATSPKDLFPWADGSLAEPLQPPFSDAQHVLPGASFAHCHQSEVVAEIAASAGEQKSDMEAEGRSAGIADATECRDTSAKADGLNRSAGSHGQQAAPGSAGPASNQQEAYLGVNRSGNSPGLGEDHEKLRSQAEALLDAGLISPASEVSSQDRGEALGPNVACLEDAETSAAPSRAAGCLPVAGHDFAGGLIDFGRPVVAAAASPCNRSSLMLLFASYILLTLACHII